MPDEIASHTRNGLILRKKTRHVSTVLEHFLGIPQQREEPPDPLDLLIATILSQNTNDKNSHRAYTHLREKYPDWSAVALAPLRSLIATIRVGGMARQKSARIREVLRTVKGRYGGYDLSSLRGKTDDAVIQELTSLHGVGVKTAACVLLFSLRRDLFPVDTHVHRLCGRLGLAPGCKTPEQTFEFMRRVVPRGKSYSLHTNLIRFGRKVCKAHRPSCNICPLFDDCLYADKSRISARRALTGTDHDFMLLDNVKPVGGLVRHDR